MSSIMTSLQMCVAVLHFCLFSNCPAFLRPFPSFWSPPSLQLIPVILSYPPLCLSVSMCTPVYMLYYIYQTMGPWLF